MQSRNTMIVGKMQFPSNGMSGNTSGVEIHPRQWFPDERDGFLLWLRGEFAAANAIIDLLLHHLRSISEPGEYDFVIGAIHQRRCNWTAILHMQQYFSIAEIIFALQQVLLRKEQRCYQYPKLAEREMKKMGQPHKKVYHKLENSGNNPTVDKGNETQKKFSFGGDTHKRPVKDAAVEEQKHGSDHASVGVEDDCNVKERGTLTETMNTELNIEDMKDSGGVVHPICGTICCQETNNENKLDVVPKFFWGYETFDGNQINVVEGLKLYEGIFDNSKISKLFFLANELRAAGRRRGLQGQSYFAWKRPVRGHGREMLQLGLPIADGPPEEEVITETSRDKKVEPIPSLLQEAINSIIQMQIVATKPDSCSIDFFNDGDHSHPQMYPPWYSRPICVLFLTDCEMVFGRTIRIESPGEYKGSLKLTIAPGSLLVVQGKSADFSKHAISSLQKQRILITFTKCCLKKSVALDSARQMQPLISSLSSIPVWPPPLSKLGNLPLHASGLKHYGVISTTGVLASPPLCPQAAQHPNSMQPMFVAASTVPFAAATVPLQPTVTAFQPVSSLHSTSRPIIPGTGVFLPPSGSGQSQLPAQQMMGITTAEEVDTEVGIGIENGAEWIKYNGEACTNDKLETKSENQECNGKIEAKDQQNVKKKFNSKSDSAPKL